MMASICRGLHSGLAPECILVAWAALKQPCLTNKRHLYEYTGSFFSRCIP
jgi:hypothetical protein